MKKTGSDHSCWRRREGVSMAVETLIKMAKPRWLAPRMREMVAANETGMSCTGTQTVTTPKNARSRHAMCRTAAHILLCPCRCMSSGGDSPLISHMGRRSLQLYHYPGWPFCLLSSPKYSKSWRQIGSGRGQTVSKAETSHPLHTGVLGKYMGGHPLPPLLRWLQLWCLSSDAPIQQSYWIGASDTFVTYFFQRLLMINWDTQRYEYLLDSNRG